MKLKLLTSLLAACLWVGFFSLPVLQSGCQSKPSERVVAYQTLKIVGQTAKAGMDSATALLKQETITVEQWQKIAGYYDNTFQPAYALSVATANSDLSSYASPDLIGLATSFAALITQITTASPSH